MTIEEIIRDLKSTLSPKRFDHTMGVAEKASELASIHGVCPDKAYLAGLLHDCAKCMSDKKLMDYMTEYNIASSGVSKAAPQLWHSYVGAHLAESRYGVTDREVLDAIYYHTTGKKDMSELCAIIYLADAIEEGRRYDGVDYIRRVAKTDLWKAVLLYTESSLKFIISRGKLIHPDTVELRNSIIVNRR